MKEIEEKAHEIEEKAQEIVEAAVELPEKIIESVTHTTTEKAEKTVKSIQSTTSSSVNFAKSIANKKIDEATTKLGAALPAIEKCGYILHSMDLDIGVLPKIVSRFSIGEAVSDEEKQRILQENKSNRFTYMLLSSLIKASEIKEFVKVGAMKFREIEIHVSGTPKIKLRFAKVL